MKTTALPAASRVNEVLQRGLRGSYRMHWGMLAFCGGLAFGGIFSANGLLTSVALLALPVICYLVWREGEPPVLVFACVFQWLQATAAIFYTNHFHVTLDQAYGSNALTMATWLSIAGVVALAAGVRLAFLSANSSHSRQLEVDSSRLSIGKLGILYAGIVLVSTILTALAVRLASLTQPLLAFASLKWAIVFLVCYTVLQQRRGYGLLAACVATEFVLGFSGIYSSFKTVFFVLVVAAMSSRLALRGRRLLITLICFALLFPMGVVWTAIKMDYRTFLAEEGSATGETVPIERKFTKLADLLEDITWDNIMDGLEALIMRVSYVNFFALTIENVPNRVPFENGKLWGGSVVHVLTPRLLFPDKPTLDDSERTRTYTGVEVAGMEQNTSIGIGYVGESYIDFGPIGMFVPIFLLGVLYGLINRFFISRTRHKLLSSSLAVSVLVFNAYGIEASNIKLLGGVITALIAAVMFYGVLGTPLMTYLQNGASRRLSGWSPASTPGT